MKILLPPKKWVKKQERWLEIKKLKN